MKKGFTLIELLAVIIILAIIALIATPIVLDIVDDAKKSTAKTEAKMIVDAVNLNCALYDSKVQMGTLETNPCADGVSDTEIKGMVDSGNYTSATITYENSKVTAATIESNGFTVTYDGSEFTIAD